MGRACSTHGKRRRKKKKKKKNTCRILIENPEGKRPLGRRRHR
jgi:hypothetical protein